jgi:hypothetical protein
MVNIYSQTEKINAILAMTEIKILVNVTMMQIILIMLHCIFDKTETQDQITEIVKHKQKALLMIVLST